MEWFDRFLDLPWIISGTLLVGGFVFLSLLEVIIVRNHVSAKTLKANHDVAGFSFGIMGVIYAVLLGFVVFNVNESYQKAQHNLLDEASVVMELFRDTATFPKKERIQMATLIRDYVEEVYQAEWSLLAKNQQSEKALKIYHAIWEEYASFVPKNEHEMAWYKTSIEKLNDLSKQRTIRIFNSQLELGNLMWTVLILGAIATVSFMCFFYADSSSIHLAMTALLSGIIGLMLFLIMSIGGIYSGNIKVSPEDLKRVADIINKALETPEYKE